MSRQWTDGAEMDDLLFWNTTNTVTVVSSTPTPRSGSWCYKVSNNGGKSVNSALSEGYLRFGFLTSAFNASKRLPTIKMGATEIGSVRINLSTGKLEAYVGASTLVGTSTVVLSLLTWYLIEVYFKLADSGGRFVVRCDGNTEIDFTGDTKPGADITFDNFNFAAAAGYDGLDDLAFNDTLGSANNSWCGEGHVISLAPNGDGGEIPWFTSSGTSHYRLVDEVPSNGDNDYVWQSGTSYAAKDMYDCEDYSLTGTSIIAVWVEARAKKTSADAGNLSLGVRPPGMLAASMHTGTPLTTSYGVILGERLEVNPHTDLAWVDSDLSGTLLCIAPSEPFV